eukprot:5530687-Pyramimonas_sp.AAC.1
MGASLGARGRRCPVRGGRRCSPRLEQSVRPGGLGDAPGSAGAGGGPAVARPPSPARLRSPPPGARRQRHRGALGAFARPAA